jgi:guanine nucleotide-binding protein G(i) subunit alpha
MLLLGAGESGKSTVLKQMKLIHHGGYSEQERDSYKEIIYSNTVQSMRAVLDSLPALDLTLQTENDSRRTVILSLPVQLEADILPREVADAIYGLWRDPAVHQAVRRAREFQLNDSAT